MTRAVRIRRLELEHHVARRPHLQTLLGHCGSGNVATELFEQDAPTACNTHPREA